MHAALLGGVAHFRFHTVTLLELQHLQMIFLMRVKRLILVQISYIHLLLIFMSKLYIEKKINISSSFASTFRSTLEIERSFGIVVVLQVFLLIRD